MLCRLKQSGGWATVLIKKNEIISLSENVRKAIDGKPVEFRDNKENSLSILKNDIHTLVNLKNEQMNIIKQEQQRLTEYLSNISHQLKTPITSMLIMVDLLETAPPEKQSEFISNIKTSLTRMEWLTSSLLKIARLDSGVVEFSISTVAMKDLLSIAVEPLAILLDIKEQNVELINEVDLCCDLRWTAEALTNLIKNASEHSPEGSVIKVDCGENPIYRWISIADSGSGIKREDISKLWTRFTGSQNSKGFGIGLPLALSIVRGQNGDIDVDSGTNGKGAVFTIKQFK